MLSDISSLTDFDEYRQDKLYKDIKKFDDKVNGGSNNFEKEDIASSQMKDHVIESMAISGGVVTPEKFESAALLPVGTTRRTLSGLFKVGWDWKPNSGMMPKKKWFPVLYGYQSLPVRYRSYFPYTYYYGIPSICPLAYRYGYVCPKGATNDTDSKAASGASTDETTDETKKSAVKGGENVPFRFKNYVNDTLVGGNDFDPKPLADNEASLDDLVKIAENMKNELDAKGIKYMDHPLYKRIKACAISIKNQPGKQRSNTSCVSKLADEVNNLNPTSEISGGGPRVKYFKSLLNVMNHHLYPMHKHDGIYGGILRKIRGKK
tara:strand:- start:8 stop:967 length:960 start_codon:yes stop_codon:yes gene_type:complete